jgi:uncharacterized lipoprotein
MMQLRFGFIVVLSAISLVGCNSVAIKNGSLDYKETTELSPLQYPEGSMVRPATPLYPAPAVDPLALEHAPVLENAKGNRFALPRPQSAQPQSTTPVTTTTPRPSPLVDGNQNPLLKMEGNASDIWQYTLATLSSLNYQVVSQSKDRYEASIKVNGQTLLLKLTSLGATQTLAVFNADSSFADKELAAELLTQIYQNWPA